MMSEDQRRFVEDVLSLYSALHFSYEALSNKTGIGRPISSQLASRRW